MADNRPEQMQDYYSKNNAVPVMDSLLMNKQIIKSGMGFDTTKQPTTEDRYDTVHSIGVISAVNGKSVTIKQDAHFPAEIDPVIAINADMNFGIGRYSYQNGYGTEKSSLQKSQELFMYGELQPGLPEPEDPENPAED